MGPADHDDGLAGGAAGSDSGAAARLVLELLGSFRLRRDGVDISLPTGGQRLVACVALRPPGTRVQLAGLLWPEVAEQRARRNLRTAVWRVQKTVPGLLDLADGRIVVAPSTQVDVQVLVSRARRLLARPDALALHDLYRDPGYSELLPGWYDDWVLLERERLRQLQLHALERGADELSRRGHYGQALDAALNAVRLEPLRETGHAAVMRIHVAEGNLSEALAHLDAYAHLLHAELGIPPSAGLSALLRDRLPAEMRLPRRSSFTRLHHAGF